MSCANEILEDLTVENPNEELLFEQYKLYVEMSNALSERRDKTNKFYVTLMSLLLTVFSIITSITKDITLFIIPLSIIILFSKVWMENISSYSTLNHGKFDVINEIEKKLPAKGFTIEWQLMELYKYKRLTNIEKYVPSIIFIISIIVEISIISFLLIQGCCFF